MKRLLRSAIAVFVLAGCRAQGPPATHPFFGQTRVPSPGTGAISGGAPDPYYGGAPNRSGPIFAPPAAGVPQTPPGTGTQPGGAGAGDRYTPPGGTLNYQGSSASPVRAPVASRPRARVQAPSSAGRSPTAAAKAASKPGGREPVVQILPPRPGSASTRRKTGGPRPAVASSRSATSEPRRLKAPAGAVQLTDLPKAGTSKSASRPESPSGPTGVRLVSGNEPSADSPVATAGGSTAEAAAKFAPRATYGYDPKYRWLRGKLEYSQIHRRWKLRYIPVDGETDQYGGSVVLPDAKVLAGCERGDFVEVRGQLGRRETHKDFAPTYEVTELNRLDPATP